MKYFLFSILIVCPLLVACGKATEPAAPQQLEYEVPLGEKKYIDAKYGKETWFAIAPLSGSEDINANGVIQAHYFENGMYRMELQLNVERAEDGKFYQAWLMKAGDKILVMAGQLHSRFGDVRHGLVYESKDDLRDYTFVIVTLEEDDGNPQPANRIAEGVLKVTER